jgi:guanylate kinase
LKLFQDLNQENETQLDDELFVGDVEGIRKLKTEMKKSVSQGGSVQILVSGIREARERLRRQEEEKREQREAETEPEVRELYTAEEMDDPDIQLAIAMSLQQDGMLLTNFVLLY